MPVLVAEGLDDPLGEGLPVVLAEIAVFAVLDHLGGGAILDQYRGRLEGRGLPHHQRSVIV